jgi:hypothetical protein
VEDGLRAKAVEERIWKLEEFFHGKTMPAPVQVQYNDLKKELSDIQERMKKR